MISGCSPATNRPSLQLAAVLAWPLPSRATQTLIPFRDEFGPIRLHGHSHVTFTHSTYQLFAKPTLYCTNMVVVIHWCMHSLVRTSVGHLSTTVPSEWYEGGSMAGTGDEPGRGGECGKSHICFLAYTLETYGSKQ